MPPPQPCGLGAQAGGCRERPKAKGPVCAHLGPSPRLSRVTALCVAKANAPAKGDRDQGSPEGIESDQRHPPAWVLGPGGHSYLGVTAAIPDHLFPPPPQLVPLSAHHPRRPAGTESRRPQPGMSSVRQRRDAKGQGRGREAPGKAPRRRGRTRRSPTPAGAWDRGPWREADRRQMAHAGGGGDWPRLRVPPPRAASPRWRGKRPAPNLCALAL